jgi:hypothetical protein
MKIRIKIERQSSKENSHYNCRSLNFLLIQKETSRLLQTKKKKRILRKKFTVLKTDIRSLGTNNAVSLRRLL